MASDQYETGLSIRKEVLGDEYVDAAIAKADSTRFFRKTISRGGDLVFYREP